MFFLISNIKYIRNVILNARSSVYGGFCFVFSVFKREVLFTQKASCKLFGIMKHYVKTKISHIDLIKVKKQRMLQSKNQNWKQHEFVIELYDALEVLEKEPRYAFLHFLFPIQISKYR